jgi:transposase-like protein
MRRKPKYSKETKIEIVRRYIKGESATKLALEFSIGGKYPDRMIYEWVHKYEVLGKSAFNSTDKNKTYSKELKLAAINDYLNGEGSMAAIVNKYEISSSSVLITWLNKYNSHIETKDYDPKPEVYMAKSRKTTYEERIEIVKYCLEHEGNYKETAIKYGVNYAQVYEWVNKYKKNGEEGLTDKRGQKKLDSEMTEEEKLRHQLKKEQARIKYLEMENAALKKLEEIERREIAEKSKRKSTKRYLN